MDRRRMSMTYPPGILPTGGLVAGHNVEIPLIHRMVKYIDWAKWYQDENIEFTEKKVEEGRLNQEDKFHRLSHIYEHCKFVWVANVEAHWKSGKARGKRGQQVNYADVRRLWDQYAAATRGFVSRHMPEQDLDSLQMREIKCPHLGISSCSNSVYDMISGSIMLIPHFSSQRLVDIKYTLLLKDLIALNSAFNQVFFKRRFYLSREQFYWVSFSIVEIGFFFESDPRRANVLAQAETREVDAYWAELYEQWGFQDSYETPDPKSCDLNNPGCKAAIFLPDTAHYTRMGTHQRKFIQYVKFIPTTMIANYPRIYFGKTDGKFLWREYVAQQIDCWKRKHISLQHHSLQHIDMEQCESDDASRLWVAINAVSRQTADLGLMPTDVSFPNSWQRVDVSFTVNEEEKLIIPVAQPYGCTELPLISFTNLLRVANPNVSWDGDSVEKQFLALKFSWKVRRDLIMPMLRDPAVDIYWDTKGREQRKICYCNDKESTRAAQ